MLDNDTDAEYQEQLNSITPLNALVQKYQPEAKKEDHNFLKELILWGLVEHKKLSKQRFSKGYQFRDLYGNYINGL